VKERQAVRIEVFNILGQKVSTLVDSEKNAGTHSVSWNGRDNDGKKLGSGVYFYTMTSGNFTSTKKLVLLK
jgi:flagellar hook assembly protein FlgD